MRYKQIFSLVMVFFSGLVAALHLAALKYNPADCDTSSIVIACFLAVMFGYNAIAKRNP